MNRTKIEWCDYTWNPIVGCSPASVGCQNCYAAAISRRFKLPWGKPVFVPERLDQPRQAKTPGRVFVCSMSDIGHEEVEPMWRDQIYRAMAAAHWHTFIILTKRPAALAIDMPPDNCWMGVTVCEQEEDSCTWGVLRYRRHKDDRVLFVSVEPMLEPVTFAHWDRKPDWVIAGPETGPKARPCEDEWIDRLAAQSPCFFDKRKRDGVRREWPK